MILRLFFLIIITLVFVCPPAEAARLLPRSVSGARSNLSGGGFYVSPRLRADRKALYIYIGGLSQVCSLTYTLYYQTDGIDEGVSGSVDSSSGNAITRELLFGTCSSGVCRYHSNITGMKLEVVTEYPNGKKILRRFRIRV